MLMFLTIEEAKYLRSLCTKVDAPDKLTISLFTKANELIENFEEDTDE